MPIPDTSPEDVLRRRFVIHGTLRAGGGPVEVYKTAPLDDPEAVRALILIAPESDEDLAALPGVIRRVASAASPHLPRVMEHGWLTEAEFLPADAHPTPPEEARFYFVREWVDGPILRNVLDNEGPEACDAATTLERILAVADGVAALHRVGVLHLDLTPANVVVPRGGRPVKVVGLSSCWAVGPAFPGLGHRGSPGYTAPETFAGPAGPEEVSFSADVFSLGAVLFEMLAGRTPFGTGIDYLRYWSELTRRAPPFRLPMHFEGSWGDGLLAAHLRWSLEGVPRRRPATVSEFAAPLRLLLRTLRQ